MATVTFGRAKVVLGEAYETLAELAATDLENPSADDLVPHRPAYWVGRMEQNLFAMAEMFQALLDAAVRDEGKH